MHANVQFFQHQNLMDFSFQLLCSLTPAVPFGSSFFYLLLLPLPLPPPPLLPLLLLLLLSSNSVLQKTIVFNFGSFRAKASSLFEELKHFADRIESDGNLQKCLKILTEGTSLSLETSVAEMKEDTAKFSSECWTGMSSCTVRMGTSCYTI